MIKRYIPVKVTFCLIVCTFILLNPFVLGEEGSSTNYTPDTIGTHNVILVKIFGERVQEEYHVDDLGFINHAIAGKVKLAGLTIREAERTLETKLRGRYIVNPIVTIVVTVYSKFSILGEVRNPGRYEIKGRVHLSDAIAMAGGFNRAANERKVKILRKAGEASRTITIDTMQVTKQGRQDADMNIQDGDLIVVPRNWWLRRYLTRIF